MKKTIVIPLAFIALLLTSCSDTPEKVAEEFIIAIENQDFTRAKKYGSKKTQTILTAMENATKDEPKVKYERKKFVVDSVNRSEKDKAIVYFKYDGAPSDLPLIKEDGKWKVTIDKGHPKEDYTNPNDTEEYMEEEQEEQEMTIEK